MRQVDHGIGQTRRRGDHVRIGDAVHQRLCIDDHQRRVERAGIDLRHRIQDQSAAAKCPRRRFQMRPVHPAGIERHADIGVPARLDHLVPRARLAAQVLKRARIDLQNVPGRQGRRVVRHRTSLDHQVRTRQNLRRKRGQISARSSE